MRNGEARLGMAKAESRIPRRASQVRILPGISSVVAEGQTRRVAPWEDRIARAGSSPAHTALGDFMSMFRRDKALFFSFWVLFTLAAGWFSAVAWTIWKAVAG